MIADGGSHSHVLGRLIGWYASGLMKTVRGRKSHAGQESFRHGGTFSTLSPTFVLYVEVI